MILDPRHKHTLFHNPVFFNFLISSAELCVISLYSLELTSDGTLKGSHQGHHILHFPRFSALLSSTP